MVAGWEYCIDAMDVEIIPGSRWPHVAHFAGDWPPAVHPLQRATVRVVCADPGLLLGVDQRASTTS
jgi:hypothetical protein